MKFTQFLRWGAVGIILTLLPLGASGAEAPATEDGDAVYFGAVGLRTLADGYVIAVEGRWGSRNFFFRSDSSVPELAAFDGRGKVIRASRELKVVLPGEDRLLRLALAPGPSDDLDSVGAGLAWGEDLRSAALSRYGVSHVVEVLDGYELAEFSSAFQGLTVDRLSGQTAMEVAAAQREALEVAPPGFDSFQLPAFNQTPPDDGSGGCAAGGQGATMCSVEGCPLPPTGCTISCSSPRYACCYCSGTHKAACRCR